MEGMRKLQELCGCDSVTLWESNTTTLEDVIEFLDDAGLSHTGPLPMVGRSNGAKKFVKVTGLPKGVLPGYKMGGKTFGHDTAMLSVDDAGTITMTYTVSLSGNGMREETFDSLDALARKLKKTSRVKESSEATLDEIEAALKQAKAKPERKSDAPWVKFVLPGGMRMKGSAIARPKDGKIRVSVKMDGSLKVLAEFESLGDFQEWLGGKSGGGATKLTCNECGKTFSKRIGSSTSEVECPKCGGTDVEPS